MDALFNKIQDISILPAFKNNNLDSYLQSKIPCPFLNNGLCSLYDFRPYICRMYHSIDIKSCELHIDITKEGETGAKQLSNITQKYLNIYMLIMARFIKVQN